MTASAVLEQQVAAPALEARGIVKRFDGIHALDGVNLSVVPGEIHALLGENGAGKSTLIKVITGLYAPDAGQILRKGEQVEFTSVRNAHKAGIVALYQELSIVPTISVAENILLGERMPSTSGVVRWKELGQRAQVQLDRLNQKIPLTKLAGDLSPVQQTMVSVARALSTDAQVLILDEPTAALTDVEISDLFAVLRSLRDEGVAIIYVSHRLEEVFELCDRLTIMRNGETVTTKPVAETTVNEVISAMVGRPAGELFPERATTVGPVVVEVSELHGKRVKDVSFTARAGEVVGIGGLAGSGRSELLRIIAGAQKQSSGSISVNGEPITPSGGVGKTLEAGIALVPEERRTQGVMLDSSIQDNISVANLASVSSLGWVSDKQINALARWGISDLKIKARGPQQAVGELSGGNQQKVVLAKMLARKPKVLLMDEPTRGIDVGTKAEIYRLIRKLVADGAAVIAVSSELPELIGMSDRIIIMHEGRVSAEVDAAETNDEELLSYCYGRVQER